jgi:monofunctional biosynthetic peptidoglycan transglycosylase
MALEFGVGVKEKRFSAWSIVRLARFLLMSLAGFIVFLLVLYRYANPPGSTLMALESFNSGGDVARMWVPFDAISPNLVRAVIASEDNNFCRHRGVDWGAINEAIDRAGEDGPRGASTISMQTAKNLFLWNSRSYLRKAIEIPLTYGMELVWSKRRILEVYLNIVEWGPGVYGAEAAARYHFNKSAARLSLDEAALLAAALPAPLDRDAGNPGPTTSRLAARLRKRLDSGPDVRCLSLRVQRVREVEGKSKSGR